MPPPKRCHNRMDAVKSWSWEGGSRGPECRTLLGGAGRTTAPARLTDLRDPDPLLVASVDTEARLLPLLRHRFDYVYSSINICPPRRCERSKRSPKVSAVWGKAGHAALGRSHACGHVRPRRPSALRVPRYLCAILASAL